MEGILHDNNAGILAEEKLSEPDVIGWAQLQEHHEGNKTNSTSLTKIDGLDGANEEDVYGSEFQNVDGVLHTPFYDRFLTTRATVPWLAENQEWTYMNRTKPLNEQPYKSYRELRFNPIPSGNYGAANLEHFDIGQDWIFKLIALIIIVFVFYRLVIEIK